MRIYSVFSGSDRNRFIRNAFKDSLSFNIEEIMSHGLISRGSLSHMRQAVAAYRSTTPLISDNGR
jgi:hypothetical protein